MAQLHSRKRSKHSVDKGSPYISPLSKLLNYVFLIKKIQGIKDVNLISLLYEKKREQIHMFDLVECAYSLDNIEALEYFLSMNVPTFLPNCTINNKKPYNININNNNNNNNNTTAALSSSSFNLNNSNNNNYTTTVALAFSLKIVKYQFSPMRKLKQHKHFNSNDSNISSGSSGCNNKNSNSFLINNGNITLPPPPSSYRNLIKIEHNI
ncbi:hypothetical protein DICPUDRAFT_81800 [Dictyostelium purpureum]|uniref:Uncharacterized protein n=1 Tax=Dictyostelium purpureum TaxID=5786 RepID=F0ZUM2_DICPU|nr:uncharacterized protein DICPUDRAFT_81800 [Dictyostelium purpureum]EGC32358.1 hypothetical protein DICPUDRAFT_81800 [Dictyostelium purpureum]|eukprot:XP_003291123.1 hypothetical protein DICPUDRAFT_81800 [Dictyostelium purpureum]